MLFTKLYEYIGDALEYLMSGDSPSVFRLIKSRVFFINHELVKLSTNVPKEEILCAGIQVGKFTKGGKFRLNVTCLDLISRYSANKIWVKSSGEMPYLYGNHVIKAHIARMTENIAQYSPVCVYNLQDLPLGFGVAARGTLQTKDLEPTAVVIFNQADTGEYLRTEDE